MKRAVALLLSVLVLLSAPLQRAAYADLLRRGTPVAAGAASRPGQNPGRFKEGMGTIGGLALDVVRTNVGRAMLGAIVAATALGYHGHTSEKLRSQESEIVFSERSQAIRDAAAAGQKIDPLSDYHAMSNDMLMKVLEAKNLSSTNPHSGSAGERFAKELQIKMELDTHTLTLPKLFNGLMDEGVNRARAELAPIGDTRKNLNTINPRLSSAWSHRSLDNYHDWDETVRTTESYTDSNGKPQSRPVTTIVHHHDYVDTDHWWSYTPTEGLAASQGLDAARQQVPQIKGVRLRTASTTHAENEYAIESSRHLTERLSKDALRQIAGTWAAGSTYMQNIGALEQMWNDALVRDQANVRSATGTAKNSYHYVTHSTFDSGPPEAQSFDRTLSNSSAFIRSADEIYQGLDHTQRNTKVLEAEIKKLLAVAINKTQPGNADEIADGIITKTNELYQLTFKKGVDLRAYRSWVFMLWLVGGLTLGGALGSAAGPAVRALKQQTKRFVEGGT